MNAEYTSLRIQYNQTLARYCMTFARFRGELNKMKDGEVFSHTTFMACIESLRQTEKTLKNLRETLHLIGGYDFTKTIHMQGCRLEEGLLLGTNTDRAMDNAKLWIKRSPMPDTDCTLYEIGMYLLCLSTGKYL